MFYDVITTEHDQVYNRFALGSCVDRVVYMDDCYITTECDQVYNRFALGRCLGRLCSVHG